MPYTVWGAFDQFRRNTVDLDPTETSKARSSRDYLFEQLKKLAKDNPDFPLSTSYYFPFGSFARRTKIRPLDDVDVMILLNGRGTTDTYPASAPYTSWLKISDDSAPLAAFPDDFGYVNSTKILNKLKGLLATVPSYRKADVAKNMQAVVLNLTSYTWSFDIVPAVPIADAQGNTIHYLIPNGKGDWQRTDPRIDQSNITRVNQKHNGQFLPLVRLLKYWNQRTVKPVLGSYYFEVLALKVFDATYSFSSYAEGVKRFFDNCGTYLWTSCPDPKKLGPDLDADETQERKGKVADAMAEAARYAGTASWYESQEKPQDAIYWWGKVFGPEFPTYGG